ncbi:hypothetical protein [Pseudomonas tolaasii]
MTNPAQTAVTVTLSNGG